MAGEKDSLDQRWQSSLRTLSVQRARLAAALAAVLVPAGAVLDWVLPEHVRGQFLAVRLATTGVIALIFALTFWSGAVRFGRALLFALAVTIATGIGVLQLIGGPAASDYYAGLLVTMVALGILYPWGVGEMAVTCITICAISAAALFERGRPDLAAAFKQIYFLVNTAIVVVAGSYFTRSLREREFRAREALEQKTRELRELDELKTRFFANVSHELRTPLTVVQALVEELRRGSSPDAPKLLASIDRNAQLVLHLINDLLELSQLDAGKAQARKEPFSLSELAEEQVEAVQLLAEHKGVRLRCKNDPVGAFLDREKTAVILRNLISNALKFTGAGGEVDVSVGERNGEAWLMVRDTGPGIAPEDHRQIFDRWVRLQNAEQRNLPGSGVGLALLKELSEMQGGAVEVVSAVGLGSTFIVRFAGAATAPVGKSAPTPHARLLPQDVVDAIEAQELPVTPSSERVLIVEDNHDLRAFLETFLGRAFQVLSAPDGAEALELLSREHVDLVVSDIRMPRLSGHDLLQKIRANDKLKDLPVLLFTAHRGVDAAVASLNAGADDFLGKPFSPRELLARVQALIRMRRLHRQLSQAEKLSMLGTLSAGLAHEIRNPINALVNSVPLIRQDRNSAEADELLEVVEQSAHRVSRIVDDFLGYSRQSTHRPSRWHPPRSIDAMVRLLKLKYAQVQVEPLVEFEDEVAGHPDRLDRVLMNLLDNAAKAVDGKGRIRVHAKAAQNGLQLTVADDGPGIPPDVLPRIFEPFFSLRAHGEGTGLGLHLALQTVRAHGGRLEVHSEPGKGATFTLWLPLKEVPDAGTDAAVGG
ncbi:MAG: ATP-binding protein [Myxococcaceae bacterium]